LIFHESDEQKLAEPRIEQNPAIENKDVFLRQSVKNLSKRGIPRASQGAKARHGDGSRARIKLDEPPGG
jgi:hypothetical protein